MANVRADADTFKYIHSFIVKTENLLCHASINKGHRTTDIHVAKTPAKETLWQTLHAGSAYNHQHRNMDPVGHVFPTSSHADTLTGLLFYDSTLCPQDNPYITQRVDADLARVSDSSNG
jgi:hypothetical protein